MLNESDQNYAEHLRDEIIRRKTEYDEAKSAADRAEADLDEAKLGTRLLDQHVFLLWLGGDRAVYERIRPLRRTFRQHRSQAERIERLVALKEKELAAFIPRALKRGDPKYQELLKKQRRAKKARDSCTHLRKLVATARQTIDEALALTIADPRGEEAGRNASKVSIHVRAVRNQAASVNRKARDYRRLDPGNLKKLNTTFSGRDADIQIRIRQLKTVAGALESIDREAESLLAVIVEHEIALEDEIQRYGEDERRRFD